MYTKPMTENEMLPFGNLTTLTLNDFDGFEKALFTEEERALPGFERFAKFYEDTVTTYGIDKINLYLPISMPEALVEFQLNHYVLWGVMALTRAGSKPYNYFYYNDESDVFLATCNDCFACEYSQLHMEGGYCDRCPIYKNEDIDYECEKTGKPFHKWREAEHGTMEKEEYAEECMLLEWHDWYSGTEEYEGVEPKKELAEYFGVLDCTPDQLLKLKESLWEDPDSEEIFTGLDCAGDIPDEVVITHYMSVNFTNNDFFCYG